jgi:hypothetical protein
MAREQGQKAIKNLDIIKDRAAQVSKIFDDMPIDDMSKAMQKVALASASMSEELGNSLKYSKQNVKTAQDQSKAALAGVKYSTTRNKLLKGFRGLQIQTLKGQDEFTEGLKESTTAYEDLKQGAKDVVSEMGRLASEVSELDNLFGGIGETIGQFVSNPLTIATGLLLTFNSQQEAIAGQFGAMGVTRFGSDLKAANTELSKLGFSAEESQKAISDIANQFGLSVQESAKLAQNAGEIAVGLGMSLDESTKLLGTLTTIGGLTSQQATDLAKQTASLAEANNVAPDEVLNDIANNTELFAKFAKDGGANVARAAIQARKLGLEIGDVADSMEGMLDFQGSLNAEIEASVMLGRNLNLQKARELSLAGDIEGFQREILKQVGREAEFNKMNVLQKQALAKATGLSVDKLGKMVSKEKEAATLAGELNKQKVEDLVSAEALTGVAQFMNEIKAIGIELSNTLGPAINTIVGAFASMVSGLNSIGGVLPVVITLLGAMAVKSTLAAAANVKQSLTTLGLVSAKEAENVATNKGVLAYAKNTAATIANTAVKGASALASYAASAGAMVLAAANFFAGAAAGSLASLGFGAPALIAFAVAGIAAMVAGIMKARQAGDMMSPASGKTMISTKEGGLFEMSKNDDILAAPGLAGAMAGGGTTNVTNVDTSGIERGNAEVKGEMASLRAEMREYFGFGGSAIKGIGSKVGDTFERGK